uniref:gamma-parvin n=1 Tax=Panthera onca TaxID=9690 RepID=UPI00295333C7|nr:gamma-parvin [Panthera onca]
MAARAGKAEMEPESLYNLLQLPKAVGRPAEEELPQGEKKKYLPPTSRGDPKFEELQKVLMDWINAKLLPEHIVVRSLEEDIFDGLILHHLFQTLTGLRLDVEEMALTVPNQRRKLEAVLEAVNRSLQAEDQPLKWSMDAIFNKDLLATLHLLVALAKRFQPDLPLPTNVQVEVITMEVRGWVLGGPLCTGAFIVLARATALIHPSTHPSSQPASQPSIHPHTNPLTCLFAYLPVHPLTHLPGHPFICLFICSSIHPPPHPPIHPSQRRNSVPFGMAASPGRLHNVTLALELLKDEGLLSYPISPEDIVNKDTKSTLRVLYSLFRKHKLKENADSTPRGSPN